MIMAKDDGRRQRPRLLRPRPVLEGVKRVYCYDPEPDITVAELAEVMEALLLGVVLKSGQTNPELMEQTMLSLSPEARRHFTVREKTGIVIAQG